MSSDNPPDQQAAPESLANINLDGIKTLADQAFAVVTPRKVALPYRLILEVGRQSVPELVEPVTCVLDRQDRLVLLDAAGTEYRLFRFLLDGTFDGLIANIPRSETDGLLHPTGLAFGGDGQMYIPDGDLNAVLEFSPDGRWLETYRTAGDEFGSFQNPRDVEVGEDGRLYVADSFNDRVVILGADGSSVQILSVFDNPETGEAEDSFYEPSSVCLAPGGTVVVADTNQHRVLAFSGGRLTASWSAPDLFRFPTEVRISRDGSLLFVADQGNLRIQKFVFKLAGSSPVGTIRLAGGGKAGDIASQGDIDVTPQGDVIVVDSSRRMAVILGFIEE